jgi:hypothetical protein
MEIHRNKKDPWVAIFYRELGDGPLMRAAVWIFDVTGLENSVHSARLAHAHEIEQGRRQG